MTPSTSSTEPRSVPPRDRGPGRWAILALIGITVLPRAVHLLRVVNTPVFTYHRTFEASDMYLFDQWARHIVSGDVLGRQPYQPVIAWQLDLAPLERWNEWYGHPLVFYKAPFYPYLIALLYRLFGDAMLPLAILQIGAAAGSAILLLRIGTQLVGREAGWLGAILFALYAPAIHYDVVMLRGPWIVLVSLLVTSQLIALRLTPSLPRAGWLGLTVGAALLVNEGFLLLPVLVLGLIAWWVREVKRVAALGGGFLIGTFIALAPVILRNVLVGAPTFALAVTGSCIFAVFNAPDSNPFFFSIPPSLPHLLQTTGGRFLPLMQACVASFSSPAAYLLFYLQKASGIVIPYENPDNANFYYAALKNPLLRVLPDYGVLFPLAAVGLALALRRRERLAPLLPVTIALFASIMLTLPLSRYRATLAVYLMPLAGVTIAQSYRWFRERRAAPLLLALGSSAAIAAAAAAFQQRVVFGGAPAGPFLYRPPEFALAAIGYARAGRYPDALAELLELIRYNPGPDDRAVALSILASLGVDQRDPTALREFLRRAAEAGGNDAEFLMAIGDFSRQRLRDKLQARTAYESALALHPSAPTEQALRLRLGTGDQSPPTGGPK